MLFDENDTTTIKIDIEFKVASHVHTHTHRSSVLYHIVWTVRDKKKKKKKMEILLSIFETPESQIKGKQYKFSNCLPLISSKKQQPSRREFRSAPERPIYRLVRQRGTTRANWLMGNCLIVFSDVRVIGETTTRTSACKLLQSSDKRDEIYSPSWTVGRGSVRVTLNYVTRDVRYRPTSR